MCMVPDCVEHVPDSAACCGDEDEQEEEEAGEADAHVLDQVLGVAHVLVVPLLRLLQDHGLEAFSCDG